MKPFWWGLVLSSFTAYPIFRLLLLMNSRQKVSEFAPQSHQAKQGTPTMGGLIFAIPFILIAPFISFDQPPPEIGSDGWFTSGMALILLFALFAAIGFVDDFVIPRLLVGKRGLGWKQKLGLQFFVALGYSLSIKHEGWQIAFDILIILAVANAYNFADGLDSLAASIALLLVPGLMVLNFAMHRSELSDYYFLIGGAMLPFAFLNAPKAKVFMGDVGSLAFGALAGASLAVPLGAVSNSQSAFGIVVLSIVLIAELFPVPMQIFWVKVFKRRLFPFTPIHHAFEKAGWPETRVVAMFALAQLVCTMGAIDLLMTYGSGFNQG